MIHMPLICTLYEGGFINFHMLRSIHFYTLNVKVYMRICNYTLYEDTCVLCLFLVPPPFGFYSVIVASLGPTQGIFGV